MLLGPVRPPLVVYFMVSDATLDWGRGNHYTIIPHHPSLIPSSEAGPWNEAFQHVAFIAVAGFLATLVGDPVGDVLDDIYRSEH